MNNKFAKTALKAECEEKGIEFDRDYFKNSSFAFKIDDDTKNYFGLTGNIFERVGESYFQYVNGYEKKVEPEFTLTFERTKAIGELND